MTESPENYYRLERRVDSIAERLDRKADKWALDNTDARVARLVENWGNRQTITVCLDVLQEAVSKLDRQIKALEKGAERLRGDVARAVRADQLDQRALDSLVELTGIQQTQLRDQGRDLAWLKRKLDDHMAEAGVSE